MSIVVSVAIVWSAWGLLRKSFDLALDAVPEGIDVDAVRIILENVEGVRELHDLHIWALSTTENALTAHLVMTAGSPADARSLGLLRQVLRERFGIAHVTLQVEALESHEPCAAATDVGAFGCEAKSDPS